MGAYLTLNFLGRCSYSSFMYMYLYYVLIRRRSPFHYEDRLPSCGKPMITIKLSCDRLPPHDGNLYADKASSLYWVGPLNIRNIVIKIQLCKERPTYSIISSSVCRCYSSHFYKTHSYIPDSHVDTITFSTLLPSSFCLCIILCTDYCTRYNAKTLLYVALLLGNARETPIRSHAYFRKLRVL